ncbi:hypothetical protein KR009_009799 [Drosophila setifemur]|nr:hypothetical protein KR009_009799 [Drosophila setifemur]
MHIKAVLAVFAVLCVVFVSGQNVAEECNELERSCRSCVRRLNYRQMPAFNNNCREKTKRKWRWRNLDRCDYAKLQCQGWDGRLDCDDIARISRMHRNIF